MLPEYQAERDLAYEFLKKEDYPKQVNEYRKTIIQLIGGIVVIGTLYFTWRRIRATEKNIELGQRNIILTEKGQVSERFFNAVEQLEKEELSLRLSGIFSLKRIAQEYPKDYHWVTVEVLTSFVRSNTSQQPEATDGLNSIIKSIPVGIFPGVEIDLTEVLE